MSMQDESSTERLRLFVAIPVPDAVREEMIRVQRKLQPLAPHGAVRWTKPEQFHLTLRFLGDVPSNRVPNLREAIGAVCVAKPVLNLSAQGVGFFPHARSPRVIWIGVNDGEDRLAGLQRRIETAVSPFTAEQGGEIFSGHVTLGRFKSFNRLESEKLTDRSGTMNDHMFGRWMAREIELIQSELSSAGARHSVLAVFPLNAKIGPG